MCRLDYSKLSRKTADDYLAWFNAHLILSQVSCTHCLALLGFHYVIGTENTAAAARPATGLRLGVGLLELPAAAVAGGPVGQAGGRHPQPAVSADGHASL